jgi:hypothetical protein
VVGALLARERVQRDQQPNPGLVPFADVVERTDAVAHKTKVFTSTSPSLDVRCPSRSDTESAAADYASLVATFDAAYLTATSGDTRGPMTVAAKDTARANTESRTRQLATMIKANPTVGEDGDAVVKRNACF